MRDDLAVGPAAAFAADVREELEARRPDVVLTELLLFGPQVAAEAAGVPYVVLNPTINVVPAPGVPPFGQGLLPAASDEDRRARPGRRRDGDGGLGRGAAGAQPARAEQGLRPLEHVLDQGRSAALTLVLTSAAFDLAGGCRRSSSTSARASTIRAGPSPGRRPPGDDPLVLVALSSDFQNQGDLLRRIAAALGELPVRGVVTTGKGIDPADVPAAPNVQVVRSAPHAQVLEEAAAVITHCGHGTTIKALAAGVPLVCLPMGRDQLDVAARVVHRGAGVRLDAAAEPQAIGAALDEVLAEPGYRAAAERIAAAIAEETAHDRAVAEIEALIADGGAGLGRPGQARSQQVRLQPAEAEQAGADVGADHRARSRRRRPGRSRTPGGTRRPAGGRCPGRGCAARPRRRPRPPCARARTRPSARRRGGGSGPARSG